MPPELVSTRRQLLAGGATAATAALAGCATVLDQIADQLLEDVNVLNEADQLVSGSIELTAADDAVLDAGFSLEPPDDDGNPNLGTYEDVWTGAGDYEVRVELDESIDGESNASGTFSVEEPEDEMLVVLIGAEDVDHPIDFRVGTDFTDLV